MKTIDESVDSIVAKIQRLPESRRLLIALAGAPGSGKSTLAAALVDRLISQNIGTAALVPMDGYHYDNEVLTSMGILDRKGSPETFDAEGLLALLATIRTSTSDVRYPLFDREMDCTLPNSGHLSADIQYVVVEGNYLLLDGPVWQDMQEHFDLTVFLSTPIEELERRLMQRWTDLGFSQRQAELKVNSNDLPNARAVLNNSLAADLVI